MAVLEDAPVSPPAVRLNRPGWRDPRLLLGVVLVALSVALGSWLVSAAARTVPVYAAEGALVPGDVVSADRLVVAQVPVGETSAHYLSGSRPVPEGLTVVRTVGDGELVPLSALASGDRVDVRPVAITPTTPLPSAVVEGSRVDLWFVPEATAGPSGPAGSAEAGTDPGSARELAAGLTVAEVSGPDGGFALGTGVTVHVLVPVDMLAGVLATLGADGSVEIVHVPGGADQG